MMLDKTEDQVLGSLIAVNLILAFAIWYLYRLLTVQVPQIFVQIPYQPANIAVDASDTKGPIHPFWLGFAQGGEEMTDMLSSTVGKMKALRPSYVRLDHIFDDDYYGVVSGGSGNLSFNWSKLDRTVEAIQAMGAKPFLSLGYMPGALAGSKIDAPRNWDDWATLVRATVEHYSGKGAKNISGVYYEVWNEPDLESFGKWGRGGGKNYLTLYEYAARGAMAAQGVNNFYIGGPATTDLYANWILDLYRFCGSKKLRLDFLSWHLYTHNTNRYSSQIADIYRWFGAARIPRLVISEWGPTPEKSNSYAGTYAAAHAFSTVRELLDLVNLTTAFEVKDGPGQGNMGWGLLTHDQAGLAAKPRYQAFVWLSGVRGQRLSLTGEGSNVKGWAAQNGTNTTIYLVNFGAGANTESVAVKINSLATGTEATAAGNWRLDKEILFGKKESLPVVAVGGGVQTTIDLAPNQVGRVTLLKM